MNESEAWMENIRIRRWIGVNAAIHAANFHGARSKTEKKSSFESVSHYRALHLHRTEVRVSDRKSILAISSNELIVITAFVT